MRSLLIPALVAFALPITAAEMTLSDLRFGAGILSNDFTGASSTTVNNGGGGVTTTNSSSSGRDSDRNYRGEVEMMFGHLHPGGGFIIGFDFAVNHATFVNPGEDAHVTTPVVDLLLGYGIAVNQVWHFEITPFVGGGRAYYSFSDANGSSTSKEWNKYVEYGARIATYWTLPSGLQLGIEVPYLVGRFNPDFDYTNSGGQRVTVSDERKNRGFGVLANLGIRF